VTEKDPRTEIDPRQVAIDALLRRSLAAPLPNLPPDFEQRVMREVRRRSQPLGHYRLALFSGYALTSIVASAVVMRGQGLNWSAIALLVLSPLAVVATISWVRRATHPITPHTAN
jgi:hypothetical protein